MNNLSIVIIIAIALLLFLGSVLLRSKTKAKYEIKNIDLIIAALPIVIWLLLSNKLEEVNFLGVGIKTADVFADVANTNIGTEFTSAEALPIDQLVEEVGVASKSGTGQIPMMVKTKIEALQFRLGHGGYDSYAIREYLNRLLQYPYLKFVVIEHENGALFGYFDARILLSYLEDTKNGYAQFEASLNQSMGDRLVQYPGFMGVNKTANEKENRQTILKRMDEFDMETLVVIDDSEKFIGTLDRSRLLASLIIDFTNRIEEQKE